jgi:hypothetical protein
MKNIYKNSTEDELVNGLKSMEVTPPIGLWDDIEATLVAKRQRKIFIITSWASAATIALLFSIGGIYLISNKTEITKTQKLVSKKENTPIINNTPTNKQPENRISQNQVAKSLNAETNYQRSITLTATSSSTDSLSLANRSDEIPSRINSIRLSYIGAVSIKHEVINSKLETYDNGLNNVIASVDIAETKQKGEWLFAATGFPVYSFHTAGAMNQSAHNTEKGIVAWGGSASVQFTFANKYFFESGLTYNTLGQQEKNLYLVASNAANLEVMSYGGLTNSYGVLTVPNTDLRVMGYDGVNSLSTGAINASSFDKVDALQRFRYLEVPILFGKGFKLKSFDLKLKVGLVAGFLIGNHLDLNGANLKLRGKTIGVDPVVASTQASLGISFPIANRYNFVVEPTFRMGLKSLNSNSSKSYPFATYIKFGVEIPF